MLLVVWNISQSIWHKSKAILDAKLVGKFPIAFGGVRRTPTGFSLHMEGKADEKS